MVELLIRGQDLTKCVMKVTSAMYLFKFWTTTSPYGGCLELKCLALCRLTTLLISMEAGYKRSRPAFVVIISGAGSARVQYS